MPVFIQNERVIKIKRFCIRLRTELYDRVKLLARHYNMSANKMFIKLIEIGYLKMIGDDSFEKKNIHR
jgi:predicted DNA-binding protein